MLLNLFMVVSVVVVVNDYVFFSSDHAFQEVSLGQVCYVYLQDFAVIGVMAFHPKLFKL